MQMYPLMHLKKHGLWTGKLKAQFELALLRHASTYRLYRYCMYMRDRNEPWPEVEERLKADTKTGLGPAYLASYVSKFHADQIPF